MGSGRPPYYGKHDGDGISISVLIVLVIIAICFFTMFGCVAPSECRRMMQEAYWQGQENTAKECNRALDNMRISFEKKDKYIDFLNEQKIKREGQKNEHIKSKSELGK